MADDDPLKALQQRGKALRTRANLGTGERIPDTKVFNVGRTTRAILREHDDPRSANLLFRCPELNLAVLAKEVVRQGHAYGLRPSQLATKLTLPYELTGLGAITASGARTIYIGEPNFTKAMRDTFFGDMAQEKVDHDQAVLHIFNNVPSLDPFLLRDQFELAGLQVHPAYLELDEADWQNLCAAILADFRHIVRAIFDNDDQLEERTQVLVRKLWSAVDLDSLHPLIQALQIDPEEAQDAFFGWKGIIFYTHKYEKSLRFFQQALDFAQARARPQFPYQLRDGTPVDWDRIFAGVKRARQDVQAVVNQYRELIQSFGQEGFAARFKHFLDMASDLFWLLGSNLACLDHISATHQELVQRNIGDPELEAFIRMLQDLTAFSLDAGQG